SYEATVADGTTYQFNVIETDAAGNVSSATTDFTVIGDMSVTANFTSATDDVGLVTGTLTSGDTTDDTSLSLAGTNEAGSTVAVYNGETLLGSATVTGTGWTYEATVANGTTYQFNVIETDAAGNVSSATSNFTVIGDTAAPTTPSSIHIVSDNTTNTLAKSGDTVTVTATVDAGTTVTGTIGGKVATGSVEGTTATLTRVLDGTEPGGVGLDFTLVSTDAAGNNATTVTKTDITDSSAVETDFTAPTTPSSIHIVSDNTTNTLAKSGDTVTVTATVDAGTTVTGTIGGKATTTNTVSGTTATLTRVLDGTETEGAGLDFTLISTDVAGNNATTVTKADIGDGSAVETDFHVTAVFSSATDNVGSVTGALTTGDTTDDTTLVLAGTNEAGSTVAVYNGAIKLGDATIGGTSWSYEATVADGTTYQFNVIETDAAGNVSSATSNFTVIGDTTAPTGYSVTFDQAYANNANEADISFTFAGAEVGATYNYSINDADEAVTDTGTISSATDQITGINVSTLDDETLIITVTLTDPAGNAGTGVTDTIAKDTSDPTITGATIDQNTGTAIIGGTITATLTAGGSQADLTVGVCTINGVDVSGNFTNVGGGTYTITYTVIDGQTDVTAGNLPVSCTLLEPSGNSVAVSAFTDSNTLAVDANSPTVTSITFDDTALKIGDTATVTIVMSEAVTGFDKDDVTAPNGTLGVLSTADGGTTFTGTFTPDPSIEVSTNVAVVGTGFTDVAGNNASAGATSANYTIDTVAPTLPITGIVGTTIPGAGDQIILTFSEAVSPVDGTWSDDEFDIESPDGSTIDITGATFSPASAATTILTITLNEDSTEDDT
ncbi:MAG: Ig-like domain-containing protein, partial [Smithellaceae bacterium]